MALSKGQFKLLILNFLLFSFLFTSCSTVRKTLDGQMANRAMENSFHGLVVMNAKTDKVLYSVNGDRYFTPASNTKIFTMYASLKMLPKHIPTLNYAISGDTLYIEGTGDPSWLHPHLRDSTAIEWLKQQSNIALYPGNSEDTRFGPGWSWGDYQYYYSPERSALPLYGNVATLSNVDGLQVSPELFRDSTFVMESRVRREEDNNRFYLSPSRKDTIETPFVTSEGLTELLLENILQKDIIMVDHFPNIPKQTLYGMETDSIIKPMMFKSDNLLAEQLMMAASSTLSDTLGIRRAIDYMLEHHLQDLPQEPSWVDGSGLSRLNLFTPNSIIAILQKLYREVPEEQLFDLFPMRGPHRTVKQWEDPETEPFLFAKSGSLSNNYNLSGYLKTKSGKLLIFSFMNNQFRTPTSEIRNTVYNTLKELYFTY